MKKKMILVCGKSGSGKDTIVEKVCLRASVDKVASRTTRKKREGETNRDHIFNTQQEFEEIRHKLIAYTYFNGYEYGVCREDLDGKDLYIIDWDGIKFLKERVSDIDFIVVHIKVNPLIRFYRMLKRGDGIKKALIRIIHDYKKFKGLKADYTIENKDLNRSVQKMIAIMTSEGMFNV